MWTSTSPGSGRSPSLWASSPRASSSTPPGLPPAKGNVVGPGDIAAQTRQCFENVGDILKAAGAGFGDVVKWTMYTTDIDAFNAEAGEIWHHYFVDRPASTLVEVRRLMVPEMMVEIEAVVRLP